MICSVPSSSCPSPASLTSTPETGSSATRYSATSELNGFWPASPSGAGWPDRPRLPVRGDSSGVLMCTVPSFDASGQAGAVVCEFLGLRGGVQALKPICASEHASRPFAADGLSSRLPAASRSCPGRPPRPASGFERRLLRHLHVDPQARRGARRCALPGSPAIRGVNGQLAAAFASPTLGRVCHPGVFAPTEAVRVRPRSRLPSRRSRFARGVRRTGGGSVRNGCSAAGPAGGTRLADLLCRTPHRDAFPAAASCRGADRPAHPTSVTWLLSRPAVCVAFLTLATTP